MKYYHCSRKPHKVGDVLHPISDYNGIFVSTSLLPHYTLYMNESRNNDLKKSRLYLYRVLPLGKVRKGVWDDLYCEIGVEIVESLGQCARNGKVSMHCELHNRTIETTRLRTPSKHYNFFVSSINYKYPDKKFKNIYKLRKWLKNTNYEDFNIYEIPSMKNVTNKFII